MTKPWFVVLAIAFVGCGALDERLNRNYERQCLEFGKAMERPAKYVIYQNGTAECFVKCDSGWERQSLARAGGGRR